MNLITADGAVPTYIQIAIIWYFGKVLGDKNPKDVYATFYFVVASFCLMMIFAVSVAKYQEYITSSYLKSTVDAIINYIDFSMKWEEELIGLSLLFGIAVIPQFLTYMLSGIFGSGQSPLYVRQITSFVIVTIAKFFAFYSAIGLTLLSLKPFDRNGALVQLPYLKAAQAATVVGYALFFMVLFRHVEDLASILWKLRRHKTFWKLNVLLTRKSRAYKLRKIREERKNRRRDRARMLKKAELAAIEVSKII